MYAFTLIPGGYEITLNGRLYIDQPFDPEQSGRVPFSPEAAEIAALALIERLSTPPPKTW